MITRILPTLFTIALIIVSQIGLAQVPEGVNYQAVARDGSGEVLTNESIDVRMSVKESGPAGTTVYQETHNTSTNDFGLFDLVIGQGSAVTGVFSDIDWGSSSHFLQVEVDDGSGYTNLGTTQFVSVPYALYAKEAGNAGTSYDAGTGIDISGNTITNTGDTDPTDDITESSTADGDVSGTFDNLSVEGIQDRPVSPASPGNGEVLKWNGSEWEPAADVGGGSGDDWGSQVVQSDATLTGDGTSGSPLSVDGDLTDDQTLSISGNNLSISGGNTVSLPGGGSGDITAVNAGSGLSGGGTSGSVTLDADHNDAMWNADALQGNDVSTNTPSSGEVLKWDGSAWAPAIDDTGGGGGSVWSTSGSGSDIFYNAGNVGIGTGNPAEALRIEGEIQFSNGPDRFDVGVNSDGQLAFFPNGTSNEFVVMDDDNDYLGVGTSNPNHTLHVEGGKAMIGEPNGVIAKLTVNSSASGEELFRARKNGATYFMIDENGNIESNGDSMHFDMDVDHDLVIRFDGTEPQIIPYGNFPTNGEIGSTSNPFYQIYSENFYAEASGDYQFYSDSRIKENVASLESPVEKIKAIDGIRYDITKSHYTRNGEPRDKDGRFNHIGVMAQDVEEVFPELVETNEETGLKTVGYMGLIPVLVEGMKVQQSEIDMLTEENEDLQKQLNGLKQRVEMLEQ